MIRFICPGCRTTLQVQSNLAGVAVACSRCRQSLRVPGSPSRTTPPPLPQPRPPIPPIPTRSSQSPTGSRKTPWIVAGVAAILVLGGVVASAAYFANQRISSQVSGRPIAEPDEPQKPDNLVKEKPAERPAAKIDNASKPPPEKNEHSPLIKQILDAINARRREAGKPPVALDDEHSRGCREHAEYLAANLPNNPNLNPHTQDDLPGATSAGRDAARVCSFTRRPPLEAARAWLAAPAHGELLLAAELKTIGIGLARGNKGGQVSVFDWQRGASAQALASQRVVLHPAPRQFDVPLLYPGNEIPDPLPHTREKLTGFPVTATFFSGPKITGAAARLEDADGNDVPVWFSSPENPANRAFAELQLGTLCLFPKKPLAPGSRYAVRLSAKVNGKPWSRAWTFSTVGAAGESALYSRALARFNEIRKLAGLDPVRLDADRSRACISHAAYLARHLDRTDILLEEQNPDLPGYTREGHEIAKGAAVRLGGGPGPVDAVDWLMSSVMNRHLVLNPTTESVAIGTALHSPRGWIWVVSMPTRWVKGKGDPATLYPSRNQKDVPLHFGRPVDDIIPGQPKGHVAGFAVTANFFPGSKVEQAKGVLSDADGNEVASWLSTPEKRLPNTGTYMQILLIPRKALAPKAKYTAAMSATVDGKAWSATWSFTTLDAGKYEAEMAAHLRDAINAARKWSGLPPVALDEKVSLGCRNHARYIVRNLDHPKVQGLGIHDEDMKLPGATPEGERAGRNGVIAIISDPSDSVDGWMATIYHRIPLLNPSLKRIGYGQELHPTRGWVTVMDVSGG